MIYANLDYQGFSLFKVGLFKNDIWTFVKNS